MNASGQRTDRHVRRQVDRRAKQALADKDDTEFILNVKALLLFEAYDRGGDTTVLVDREGNISEGPGFNVFCVTAGKVISPGDTVLEGITKKTVRELCAELEVPYQVASVSPEDLRNADEVFVSSTAGGIMPIARVDDHTLSHGRPGPLSTRLRNLYWAKHEQGWHATPVRYDRSRTTDAEDFD